MDNSTTSKSCQAEGLNAQSTVHKCEAKGRLMGGGVKPLLAWLKELKITSVIKTDYAQVNDPSTLDFQEVAEIAKSVGWKLGWFDSDFLAKFMDDPSYEMRGLSLTVRLCDPLLKYFYRKTGGWDFSKTIYFDPTPAGLTACYGMIYAERVHQDLQRNLAVMVVSKELGHAADNFANDHELPAFESFKDLEELDAAISKARTDKADH